MSGRDKVEKGGGVGGGTRWRREEEWEGQGREGRRSGRGDKVEEGRGVGGTRWRRRGSGRDKVEKGGGVGGTRWRRRDKEEGGGDREMRRRRNEV